MQTALRNNVVKARVSPDEKRALLAAASCRGLTLSQFIREAVERTAEPYIGQTDHGAMAMLEPTNDSDLDEHAPHGGRPCLIPALRPMT